MLELLNKQNYCNIHCLLAGTEISNYVIERCEYGKDDWKSCPGFCPKEEFTVKGLEEGKKYVFRVRAENLYGLSEPLESAPIVAKSPFDPPGAPDPPQILSYGPTSASLQWTPPSHPGGKPGKFIFYYGVIYLAGTINYD